MRRIDAADVEHEVVAVRVGNVLAEAPLDEFGAAAVDAIVGEPVGDEGPEPVVDAGELPACLIDMG